MSLTKISRILILINFILITTIATTAQAKPDKDFFKDTAIAYIYGYPLVLMETTKDVMTNVSKPSITARAPINQFGNAVAFPTPENKDVVSPNTDTLYSSAWLDLTQEPLIMHVPDTNGRYYLMEMLDAWTNVFASIGKRTTGTNSGNFAIVGPNWQGKLPKNMTVIKAPTNTVWIIGRVQTNGITDYPAVHVIQKQFSLTPLHAWSSNYKVPHFVATNSQINMKTPPAIQVANMNAETFFNKLALAMKDNPPAKADAPLIKKMADIGIIPGQSYHLPADTTQATQKSIDFARKLLVKTATNKEIRKSENGWTTTNASFFGNYGTKYLLRAFVAMVGLGVNLPQDAVYALTSNDKNGKPLNGANRYVIHFDKNQIPPVNAFWSLAMYDPQHYFVDNPMHRYALGDRDPMQYNPDGSLDIWIQHDSPGKDKESNWLPAPTGDFNLILRLYWPKAAILDHIWKLPTVQPL